MLKNVIILILLLLVASGAWAEQLQGRVSWVYDGDTLEVSNVGKVRLLGIDTPEYKDSSRDSFYIKRFGISRPHLRTTSRRAKQFNIDHAKGKIVSLESDATRYDKYGRLLAYVYLPDQQLLNQLLVQQGLATVFRRFDFSMKDHFLDLEANARKNQLGLWAR